MSAVEHSVPMNLAGNPRWWTMTNNKGTWEIVRTFLREGVDYKPQPGVPSEMIWYLMLRPGQYAWPPWVGTAVRMGDVGIQDVRQGGGKAALLGLHTLADKLEALLMGAPKPVLRGDPEAVTVSNSDPYVIDVEWDA